MESVIEYLLSLFSDVYGTLTSVRFNVWGFSFSLFYLFLSITFMSFVFGAVLPFIGASEKEYKRVTAHSERNDKHKNRRGGRN